MSRCCLRRFKLPLEDLPGLPDNGQQKSENLHDTPLQPPKSHYLLSSPGYPVSAEGFARMVAFTTNSVLFVYRSLRALPGHLCPAQGGSCMLRDRGNSDSTDKLGRWQDWERQVPRRKNRFFSFGSANPNWA